MVKHVVQAALEPWSSKWPDSEDGPWLVTLKWDYDETGHVVCVGFEVGLVEGLAARPWTSAEHRKLALHTLVTTARAERYASVGGDLRDAHPAEVDVDLPADLVADLSVGLRGRHAPSLSPTPRTVRRGVSEGELRAVAATYSEAIESGRPALDLVMEVHHLSRATASRRLAAARDIGALPRTTRGVRRGNPRLLDATRTLGKKD